MIISRKLTVWDISVNTLTQRLKIRLRRTWEASMAPDAKTEVVRPPPVLTRQAYTLTIKSYTWNFQYSNVQCNLLGKNSPKPIRSNLLNFGFHFLYNTLPPLTQV